MNSIGNILCKWRKQNRYSQFQLATELDISARHICFIETGRSNPSKEMVLKIGQFLNIPKREINSGLLTAGFAPSYFELPVSDVKLEPVLSAIDQMITNHMPYPALVLDKNWDVKNANDSARQLLNEIGYSTYSNLIDAIASDNPDTSKICNWHETAAVVLSRVRYEISTLADSEKLEQLESKLVTSLVRSRKEPILDCNDLMFSTDFKLSDSVLSFFSIVANLDTIQDINISELRVELMFPSDQKTKEYYLD